MNVTVLNSAEELKSFPINQVIKIKFEKPVEDSQLKACISLIRNVNQTGLFNISETYNQSIGYIREKFDVEDVLIAGEVVSNSFVVSVKPVKPLSPGFEYTLFVDKSLSAEYIVTEKPVSKSSSTVKVDVSNKNSFDLKIEILSEPLITSTNNIVKVLLKDLIKDTNKQITLDLKTKNYFIYEDIKITFNSVVYVLGEVFTILGTGYESLSENLFVSIKTSITEDIKPIDPDADYSQITNEDLLNFLKKEEKVIDNKIELVNNSKVFVTLGDGLDVSMIDFDRLTFNTREAFGMYTLSSLELYDEKKIYEVIHEIVDSKSFYLSVKEKV